MPVYPAWGLTAMQTGTHTYYYFRLSHQKNQEYPTHKNPFLVGKITKEVFIYAEITVSPAAKQV